MVTGMAEDLQSLVGGTVVRRKVYARFLDAVNFVNKNSDADPEQEVISRWRIEQCSELSAVSASLYCPRRRKRTALFFRDVSCWPTPAPGPIAAMSAVITVRRSRMNIDKPTSDITKDECSKCLSGCKYRNNVGNFGGFLSINKLSQ